MQRTSKLKQLATRLLTTTCLTAAASVAAFAGTVTEPVGGFGSTFPGTLLPAGTTEVDGISTFAHGSNDYFEFQGLPGGASLSSISFQFQNTGGFSPIGVELLTDTDVVLVATGHRSCRWYLQSGRDRSRGRIPGGG